jgi:hypothetical protein
MWPGELTEIAVPHLVWKTTSQLKKFLSERFLHPIRGEHFDMGGRSPSLRVFFFQISNNYRKILFSTKTADREQLS